MIQTEWLQLRRLRDDQADAAAMLELLNEPGFRRHIGDRGVRTLAQARAYLRERVLASYAGHGVGMLAVLRRADGAWLGNAGLVRRPGLPAPDIGYALLARYQGQGYALEAARAVLDAARAHGHPHLYAVVSAPNARSMELLRKLGLAGRGLITLPPPATQPLQLFATAGAPAP